MSNASVDISAWVTAFPPGFIKPKFRPSESPLQFAIRNYPGEWSNCVQAWKLSPSQVDAIISGKHTLLGTDITENLSSFLNFTLPSHGRTLTGLADVRDTLNRTPLRETTTFRISEIVMPLRPGDPQTETASRLATKLGISTHTMPADTSRELNLTEALNHVHGDYWWLLPGATYLFASTVAFNLLRIVEHFTANSNCAFYTDGRYSAIYRVSSLRSMLAKDGYLPANPQEIANSLRAYGYQLSGGTMEVPLCNLEPEFGGIGPTKRWWQFWK